MRRKKFVHYDAWARRWGLSLSPAKRLTAPSRDCAQLQVLPGFGENRDVSSANFDSEKLANGLAG